MIDENIEFQNNVQDPETQIILKRKEAYQKELNKLEDNLKKHKHDLDKDMAHKDNSRCQKENDELKKIEQMRKDLESEMQKKKLRQ